MNQNQKIQKFLTAMFFVITCFIFQVQAQDVVDDSQQPVEMDASTIFTKDYGTKFDENFAALSPAATFTVNNNGDANDANTADGVCATAANCLHAASGCRAGERFAER